MICQKCQSEFVVKLERPIVHGPCGRKIGCEYVSKCLQCYNECSLESYYDVNIDCFCPFFSQDNEELLLKKEKGQIKLEIKDLIDNESKYEIGLDQLDLSELSEMKRLLHDLQASIIKRSKDEQNINYYIKMHNSFTDKELQSATHCNRNTMFKILNQLAIPCKRENDCLRYTKKEI